MLVIRNGALAADTLEASGLAAEMWGVEVVRYEAMGIGESVMDRGDVCVYVIVVPETYQPPNEAKFKACAVN